MKWWSIAVHAIGVYLLVLSAGRSEGSSTDGPQDIESILEGVFLENVGQWNESVRFAMRSGRQSIHLRDDGFLVTVVDRESRAACFSVSFVSCNAEAPPLGEEQLPGGYSFFRGASEDWVKGVRRFRRVTYTGVWPGIGASLEAGEGGSLKLVFHVAPGADPDAISLRYSGMRSVRMREDGSLAIQTDAGIVVARRPVAFQDGVQGHSSVPTEFRFAKSGESVCVGFEVGHYDTSIPLVIDPELVYSGYLGGSANEGCFGFALDAEGNTYLAGYSDSMDFPVHIGPNTGGGARDGFIAKVASDGALVFCGFIGGAGGDEILSVDVDAFGRACVAGYTDSDVENDGFPVQVGPDLTYNGKSEAFVARIAADGTTLDYCGYIGGAQDERAGAIAVSATGSVFVGGWTESSEDSFPVRVGPGQSYRGARFFPFWDAWIAEVSLDGSGLEYCGYIAGVGSWDEIRSIAVDPLGRAYVVGRTDSVDLPVRVGPGLEYRGGGRDAFVARIAAGGEGLEYCGFLGGTGFDEGRSAAVDDLGRLHVLGYTDSNEVADEGAFPVRVGPDLTHNGDEDVFVARVSTSGEQLDYCGYIGGSGDDRTRSSASFVDEDGYYHVTGYTRSATTFPVVGDIGRNHRGESDAFVSIVHPSGEFLELSGFLGGSARDTGIGVASGTDSSIFVGGWTDSTDFPTNVGPDLLPNGGIDAFVARIIPGDRTLANCRAGTVGGARRLSERVLRVNDSVGGPSRTVAVAPGEGVTIDVASPHDGPLSARFVCYLWPGAPDETTVAVQPFAIGTACFATPLNPMNSQPIVVWNNIGKEIHLGSATYPSTPAPSQLVPNDRLLTIPDELMRYSTLTIQGIIADVASAGAKDASLTNAVTMRIEQ